jgi:hypothetical protein
MFMVVGALRGLTHSWHWATKKGGIKDHARPFIKKWGEPHLAASLHNVACVIGMYLAGIHLLIIYSSLFLYTAFFNSFINMGANGKGFWDKHVQKGWPLVIGGKTLVFVPSLRLPKPVSYAIWTAATIASLAYLA